MVPPKSLLGLKLALVPEDLEERNSAVLGRLSASQGSARRKVCFSRQVANPLSKPPASMQPTLDLMDNVSIALVSGAVGSGAKQHSTLAKQNATSELRIPADGSVHHRGEVAVR